MLVQHIADRMRYAPQHKQGGNEYKRYYEFFLGKSRFLYHMAVLIERAVGIPVDQKIGFPFCNFSNRSSASI